MMHQSDHISLLILTPEKTLVEKHVSKVSLPGTQGRFMILKGHAPLISSLSEGEISYESEGLHERLEIASGFVEVLDNVVIVCAEL